MPCRKIASNLLWTPEGFVCHPVVTVDGEGRIVRVSVCETPDRCACTEFYAGILTPAFVDTAPLFACGALRPVPPDFRCLGPCVRSEALPGRECAKECGAKICLATDPAAPDPLRSMLDTLGSVAGVPLHELLMWATLNGALAMGTSLDAGTVETGKRCGLCILSGIDYERMALTPSASVRRIL